jgi:hypothetical protein
MPPANAERMPSGIGVDLVAFFRSEIGSGLEQSCAERHCFFVRGTRIIDM